MEQIYPKTTFSFSKIAYREIDWFLKCKMDKITLIEMR